MPEPQPTPAPEHKGEEHGFLADSRAKLALHRKLVFVFTIVGIVIGYASFLINIPLVSLVLMIIIGAVLTFAAGKAFKPKAVGGKRWWSSAIAVYVFAWLIVWTILFNMYIVKP